MTAEQQSIIDLAQRIRKMSFSDAFSTVLHEFALRKERLAYDSCIGLGTLYKYLRGECKPTKVSIVKMLLVARLPEAINDNLLYSLGMVLNDSVEDRFYSELLHSPKALSLEEANALIVDKNCTLRGQRKISHLPVW